MTSFLQFLTEANAVGSKFEQQIAKNINTWLKQNNLQDKFKASRFQTVSEAKGSRDEDYSDVVIDDLESGDQFFIECKKNIKDNIVTTQFDVMEDFTLQPVENVGRDAVDDELLMRLADDMQRSDQYLEFVDFLQDHSDALDRNLTPADFLFNREDVNDRTLHMLMKKYNKLVEDGKTEADCKMFDTDLVRESTRNMLAIALLWRLNTRHTWDICSVDNISYFGDLVRKHYLEDKAIPAKYLQLGDDLFISCASDNPFGIRCQQFPDEVSGKFSLKFTPRFGSGSMYMTPRSSITSDLESNCSFKTKNKWPLITK